MLHRWVKLRVHVYICRWCGTGKVNSHEAGEWRTTYHLPDGTEIVSTRTPPCGTGPRTLAYLEKYAKEIAAVPLRKPREEEEHGSQ